MAILRGNIMAEVGIDTREVEKQLQGLAKALNTRITGAKAGYLSNDKGEIPYEGDNPPTLEEVALWNEFGTETIPARPFLSRAQKSANVRCQKLVQARMEENADLEQIAKEIGLVLQDEIKQQITRGDFVPNAPSTIRAKGSIHTLIDTGNLRQSVHWGITARDGDKLME